MNPAAASSKGAGASGNDCFSYELVMQSIEGYAILLARKLEHQASEAEYTLRGCMYNTTSRRFTSRFYDSLPFNLVESLQGGAVICPINQAYYFYSHMEDTALVLVMELTAKCYCDDNVQEVCLGWSMFPVFLSHSKTAMGKSTHQKPNTSRLAVYEGTPRALFSLLHPTADTSSLVPIPGCILTISLEPHPTLARAVHLLPPCTIISLDDIVPGLLPTKLHEGPGSGSKRWFYEVDNGEPLPIHEAYPKLMKSTTCTLEKLSLLLLPSVDDFEDQLLANVAEDLIIEGSGVSDNAGINIGERRLKVMLFNGWQYVGSPAIGYLEKVARSYGLRSNLLLKGSLELSDVAPHPLLEVVLQLEYVISWKSNAALSAVPQSPRRGNAKPPSVHTTALTLGWAVYQPFDTEHPLTEDETLQLVKPVSLELKSGPGFTPTIIPYSAHNACYKSNLGDVGRVTFRFFPSKASSRMEGSQYLYTPTPSNLVLEDTVTPTRQSQSRTTPELRRLTRGLNDQDGATPRSILSISTPVKRPQAERDEPDAQPPLLESTIPLHPMPVEVTQLQMPVSRDTTPQHSTLSHSTMPRSTLAYFHHSGLSDFHDSKGHSLPQVTSPKHSTLTDALQHGPFQIAIQLLGFKFSENTFPISSATATRSPSSLRLELHLYHFPMVVLQCTLTPPPSDSPALPHLMQRLPRSDTTTSMTHQFGVHVQHLRSRAERSRFAAFLQHGHLMADVYDGDSLILLGAVKIPLAGLIPPGDSASQYQQQCLVCPALLSDTGTQHSNMASSITLTGALNSYSTCVGQMFVRLARLPPSAQDLTQHPKPAISTVHPDQRGSYVARRLYGSDTTLSGEEHRVEDAATKQRKQSRMNRVREARLKKRGNSVPYSESVSTMSSSYSSIIDLQREELKRERINCVLQEAMTSLYLLRPVVGEALYLEHSFTNTFNHPLSVSIAWNDPDLQLVMDKQECEYLREIHSIHAIKDVCPITEGRDGGQYGFFIHPGEAVSLPFKFQSFRSMSSDADFILSDSGGQQMEKRSIKVYFQASHRELVGIVELCIEPRQQRVDRIHHFYHPERTFLKRTIDIDTDHPLFLHGVGVGGGRGGGGKELGKLYVCASDPEVTTEIRYTDNAAAVYMKSQVKPSPSVQKFHIFIYRQSYQVSPQEVWLVVIHSAHKTNHSLTLGQSSPVKLAVRGDGSHTKVSCYSFSAPIMKVIAPSPFLLTAYSLHELHISLKTLSSEPNTVLVSAVGVDRSQLLGLWILAVTVQQPEVTRAFQISLPAGHNRTSEKSITFTNSYSKSKKYLFSTDRPDILKLKNTSAKLQPQETTVLYLMFQPVAHPVSTSALVFINDSSDQIEECFLIKIEYSN